VSVTSELKASAGGSLVFVQASLSTALAASMGWTNTSGTNTVIAETLPYAVHQKVQPQNQWKNESIRYISEYCCCPDDPDPSSPYYSPTNSATRRESFYGVPLINSSGSCSTAGPENQKRWMYWDLKVSTLKPGTLRHVQMDEYRAIKGAGIIMGTFASEGEAAQATRGDAVNRAHQLAGVN